MLTVMKRIVILTGSELRHTFFRTALGNEADIEVLRTYCEGLEKSLGTVTASDPEGSMRRKHVEWRAESEKEFFEAYVKEHEDRSRPIFIAKGAINEPERVAEIIALAPDLIVAYGCSLIKEPLLAAFPKRFLNVHLGLSPYYRGAGTNYWPLVNGEPEYVGATFMYIDVGVDTGDIIHQIRARVLPGDSPSAIGNRLISDMASVYADIIRKIDTLPKMPQPAPVPRKAYRQNDYDEESVKKLYENFESGLVEKYLAEAAERERRAPIVINPEVASSSAI